jgi:hypothetical protein
MESENPISLKVIHNRQNPIVTNHFTRLLYFILLCNTTRIRFRPAPQTDECCKKLYKLHFTTRKPRADGQARLNHVRQRTVLTN